MKYILGLSDSIINLIKFIAISDNLKQLNIILPFNDISEKLKKQIIDFNFNINFFYIFEDINIIKNYLNTNFNEINEYIVNRIKILKELNNFIYLSTSVDSINSDIIANNIKLFIKETKVYNTQTYNDLINKFFSLNFIDNNFYYQVSNYPLKVFDFFYILTDKTDIIYKTNSLVSNIFDIDLFKNIYDKDNFLVINLNKIYEVFENNFIAIKKNLKEKIYIDYLWALMIKLRYNCPWDKKQTSLSIKNHLLEEAYEVFDSIDNQDKFKEELGDLLLQIIFYSQINYDEKKFNFIDVIESLINKLIYRHPHIFENIEIKDVSDLLKNWENLKAKEQKNKKFIELPKSIPSLFKLLLIFRKFKRINKLNYLINLINEELNLFLNSHSKNEFKNYINDIKQITNLLINIAKNDINLEEILNKFLNKLIKKINSQKINKTKN
ncbi:MAG: MazG nucleotide pyrophosphohydrolase domain-containing protein [bacterium]|jgi:tetrapyrrole methylase family protein/MazG family protein